MGDTIRRQDAINVMCNIECGFDFNDCPLNYEEDGTEICEGVRQLMELPSAHPEMVQCNDCESHRLCAIEHEVLYETGDTEFYCKWGKKRTDVEKTDRQN